MEDDDDDYIPDTNEEDDGPKNYTLKWDGKSIELTDTDYDHFTNKFDALMV